MRAFAYVCLLAGTLLPPLHAAAQEGTSTLHVAARLVEVPVTVFDAHGRYVDSLRLTDFQIAENSLPQKIKYFANNSDSLACAILLDTTGSMGPTLARLKNSVVRLIDQLGPDDSVAIYSFAENLIPQQPLSKDKSAAKRAVLRMQAGGRTALYDALSETSQEMAKQSGKRAIVVFTDGDDNASVLTAQSAIKRATKNGVPLFSIAEGDATQSPKLKKVLTEISRSTGAESYEVKNLKDMGDIFQKISGELRHLYFISYQPPIEPVDGKWRMIEVKAGDGKQYRVRAKEGYLPN